MKSNIKPKFKIGDKIIKHSIFDVTAIIKDIKDGEYILDECYGTHLPFEWQDNYELYESSTKKDIDLETHNQRCAYFEKQKEQKPAEYLDKDKIYAIMKKLLNLLFSQNILVNSKEYKQIDEITQDVRSLLDYPIKQKSAEKPDLVAELKHHLATTPKEQLQKEWDDLKEWNNVGPTAKEYLYGKHTEWSEEDAFVLKDAITATDLLGNDVNFKERNPNLAKALRVAKDWLKDLPNRISLQPKQEWSKEDKDVVDEAAELALGWGCPNLSDKLKSILSHVKPVEWSEEDEDKVDDICKLIEHATIIPRSGDDDTGIPPTRLNDKYKDELKTFVKSFHRKPIQEWSEEDETRLTNILIMLKECAIHHYSKDDVNKSVEWLENRVKSLCPQSHWKPSEKQMKALEHFIRSWGESGTMSPQNPILCDAKSLYNDLDKL